MARLKEEEKPEDIICYHGYPEIEESIDDLHAWAAGIIDGEGCITLLTANTERYYLVVIVNNTDYIMLKTLAALFGGRIRPVKPKRNSRKPIYKWCVYSQEAENCLKLLLPYLIVKYDQAVIGLKSREFMAYQGGNPTKESYTSLAWLYQELKDMKHRIIPGG